MWKLLFLLIFGRGRVALWIIEGGNAPVGPGLAALNVQKGSSNFTSAHAGRNTAQSIKARLE
jgi:hypothetical protein